MKTYQKLAQLLNARQSCIRTNNTEWQENHEQSILGLVNHSAPRGSGIDCGTKIDLDASTDEKLVFDVSYHHMNDGGYYDGWTEHRIAVTASLAFGYLIKITGANRNDIKEYLHDVYSEWLDKEIPEPVQTPVAA